VLSWHFTTVRVDARLLNRRERNRVPYARGEPLHLSHKRTSRPDSAHRRSVLVLKKEKLAPANGMRRRLRCPLLKRFYCMRTTHLATLFGMLGCRHCQERYGGGRVEERPLLLLAALGSFGQIRPLAPAIPFRSTTNSCSPRSAAVSVKRSPLSVLPQSVRGGCQRSLRGGHSLKRF
jgi:hypothetical protein